LSLYGKLDLMDNKQQSDDNRYEHVKALFSANECLLYDVFESIQDGISVLDKDLIIRRTNGVMNK